MIFKHLLLDPTTGVNVKYLMNFWMLVAAFIIVFCKKKF